MEAHHRATAQGAARFLQVLAYPKFELTAEEIQQVIDEFLPYAEVTSPKGRVKVVQRDQRITSS